MIYNLSIDDIIKCTNGELICGDVNYVCENFSKDTRTINNGDIYIGIKGENFDGNIFWQDAIDNGAKAVIVQDVQFTPNDIQKNSNKIIIKVENTLKALYSIASYKRSKYNIPVIAVTGSVGKTSTKDIIASVLSQKYITLKTDGNNNNNIGLPFTILKLQNHEALVIEMGMNHLGEISLLTNIAKPTISVITNIGTSHIGNLGSRENILKAKLEILEGMNNPILVLNTDNDLLNEWYNKNNSKYEIHTFGMQNNSELVIENVKYDIDSTEFVCKTNDDVMKINVPIGGKHFIYNALCAILIGKLLELSNTQIIQGISNFELTKKRMDISKLSNGVTVINDSYNASYESMSVALEYLSSIKFGRKIAVLGDMFELGDYAKQLHEKVGELVVKNNIDILLCMGKNSKNIVDRAIKLGMNGSNVYYCDNNVELINILKSIINSGDIILFKASNGMKFFDIVEKIVSEYKP